MISPRCPFIHMSPSGRVWLGAPQPEIPLKRGHATNSTENSTNSTVVPAAPRNRRPQSSPPHSSNFQKGEDGPGIAGGATTKPWWKTFQDLLKRNKNYATPLENHIFKVVISSNFMSFPHVSTLWFSKSDTPQRPRQVLEVFRPRIRGTSPSEVWGYHSETSSHAPITVNTKIIPE